MMPTTNKKPYISVIMPAYNSAAYINDAIESVQSQSIDDWELIVIDDGSSDASFMISENKASQDERIRVYQNEFNMGVSKTRNKGVSMATGEWIAFLDSDDLWAVTKLEKQLDMAQREEASFLFTGSSFINEAGVAYSGLLEVPKAVTFDDLIKENVISCSSVLIKKAIIELVPMEKDNTHEDYLAWLKVLKTGISAYGINEPLLIYRISPDSKSGNKFKSVSMTYHVYREIGLNSVAAIYYMLGYIIRKMKKYSRIKMRK